MFKAVGRFFKKVGRGVKKHWKKVLTFSALGAAAFFTFGAALGLGAAAGGWGKAVAGFMAKIGLQGTLANVVGGAIAQAGYGALVGGAIGAATGQGFVSGAQAGALTGLVTGGVSGGFGIGPGLQAKPAAPAPVPGLPPIAGAVPDAVATGATGGARATLIKGAKGLGKFLKESGSIGPLIKGIGQGIAGDAQYEGMMARDKELRDSYKLDWDNLGFAGGPSGSYAETRPAEASPKRPATPAPASLAKSNTLTDTSERILRGM